MAKRIILIVLGAAIPATIAGAVTFQIYTQASRQEAAEIRARAESALHQLAQPGSLSPAESATVEATGIADDAALLRIRMEQEQSGRKAALVAVSSFGVFAILGMGYATIAGRHRAASN